MEGRTQAEMPVQVAVVIVSYNGCALLRRCLAHLFAGAQQGAERSGEPGLTVVVVDNGSRDGTVEMVRQEFAAVHVLAWPGNLGFTGGNNAALQYLGFDPVVLGFPTRDLSVANAPGYTGPTPEFVLLLNPDAEPEDDALSRMVDFLQRCADAGGCGGQLRYGDGRFQHGAFRFPSLGQLLLDIFPPTGLPGIHRILNSRFNGRYSAALWAGMKPFPVDFALGAALMLRGATLQAVGGLDEGFFMYCEEIDWCLRAQTAGWVIFAVPGARFIHHEAQSSRQVRWIAYVQLWRSRYRFYRKHQGRYAPAYLVLVRWLVRCGLWFRRRAALRRYARGRLSGTEVARELTAYQTVAAL